MKSKLINLIGAGSLTLLVSTIAVVAILDNAAQAQELGYKPSWLMLSSLGTNEPQPQGLLNKPAWLPQLTLGVSESYDDNVFGVSGQGMKPQRAFITKVSAGIGFDFAPLLGPESSFEKLLVNYTPDFVVFALPHVDQPAEPNQNYIANRFGTDLVGSKGDFSYSVTNNFLYNDGNKTAPTYALNQLSGADANQSDKYRDHFAYIPSRERANQFQERETADLQYDVGPAFIRAADSLLYYDLNTDLHNTSKAPYLGYQNFVDRYDANGGLDLGCHVWTNTAFTVGYRYGSQYQQQFTKAITSDYTNYSSSTYQRVLLGFEGKPWNWLQYYLVGGPDIRDYNSHTPIHDLHPINYYGEAGVSVSLASNQKLTFAYKQWEWVASTGYIPTWDSYYDLDYRWNVTTKLTLDLDARIQEYDATAGNDVDTGSDPSLRSDRLYTFSPGVAYAITPQLVASLSYTFNAGNNELYTLPSSNHAAYRDFIDQIVMLGLNYRF